MVIPAVVVAFSFLGFGLALTIAFNNAFFHESSQCHDALGCFPGAYGIGGVASPLFATAMVSNGISGRYSKP